jgi:signal transduction histidine kinase
MIYQKQNLKVNSRILLIALLVLLISWESHAQQQVILIKVYNQSMEPFANEELSINGHPFVIIDKNGQSFKEFTSQDLPPKTILLKNELFEVATWNYSKGKLEIVVRPRTERVIHLSVYDEANNPVSRQAVAYQKRSVGMTSASGALDFTVPLHSELKAEQFELTGVSIVSLESQKEGKYILRTKHIPTPKVHKADSVLMSIKALPKSRKMNLNDLDSIESFSELYSLFRQLDFKTMDERVHQRINDKFRELVNRNRNSQGNLPGYTKMITDSSALREDMVNLLMQARSERELLNAQKEEFDRSTQAIQSKLAAGIRNLSQSERKSLITDLTNLEKVLVQNEDYFSDNHEYYVNSLSQMREKFFDMSELENKLTVSEARRLEEQKRFRERIILVSSLVGLFAILVVLLLRSEKRLRNVNQKISEMNENLEDIVRQRTRMLTLANKELDTFLYRASHDLRSPVCSILGLCNIATHVANPESQDLLQKVTGTVHVMDKLLKKLSVISEINQPSGFSKISVKNSLMNVVSSFDDTISENKVNLRIQCDDDLTFYSYPNLFEVVLSNIIENALYYSLLKNTINAQIRIEAATMEDQIRIIITDNGIGIDSKIKSRLFDMFFKGHENSKGNGLGLYIVLKSVQALGGEVEVQSDPGQFTRFIVTLPDHTQAKSIGELEEATSV